jgi:hypothetical protein
VFFDKLKRRGNNNEKIVVDFGGQILYDAFRKVIDYFYLNDVAVIEGVSDSVEMMEIIKLAKTYQLKALFHAAESHFRDIMYQYFDSSSSNIFTIKLQKTALTQSESGVRDSL